MDDNAAYLENVLWLLETRFSPINGLNLSTFQQLKPENEMKIPQDRMPPELLLFLSGGESWTLFPLLLSLKQHWGPQNPRLVTFHRSWITVQFRQLVKNSR